MSCMMLKKSSANDANFRCLPLDCWKSHPPVMPALSNSSIKHCVHNMGRSPEAVTGTINKIRFWTTLLRALKRPVIGTTMCGGVLAATAEASSTIPFFSVVRTIFIASKPQRLALKVTSVNTANLARPRRCYDRLATHHLASNLS